jgi:integrase
MKSCPFSVFKRADRPSYLVAFKNELDGSFLPAISTKKTTEPEALAVAWQWYHDGIPGKDGVVPVEKRSLRSMIKAAKLTPSDAEFIVKELVRRGLLKTYVLASSKQSTGFIDFLLEFWDYEHSPYVKEKLRKSHGIHKKYCKGQYGAVVKYWLPFFGKKMIGELTRKDIDDFIGYVDAWPEKLSALRKNAVIKVGTVALRWAYRQEMTEHNLADGVIFFSGNARERPILSPERAKAVFTVPWTDERARLANILAMITGCRSGELMGLQTRDVGENCLYIRHAWGRIDNLKTPKNGESRVVEVPFPSLMRDLVTLAANNPHGATLDSFVFWSDLTPDKPIEGRKFVNGLREALRATGVSKDEVKVYTFHGWRHYFTAYMKDKVNEKLLKSQTGHKTSAMLEHYSNHRTTGDRERIQAAQVATFGGLLPVEVVPAAGV